MSALYKHVKHKYGPWHGLVMGIRVWRGVELWLVCLDGSGGRTFVEYPSDDWEVA